MTELFRELEKRLRTYSPALPIDALLPPADEIPSSLPRVAEIYLTPAPDPGELGLGKSEPSLSTEPEQPAEEMPPAPEKNKDLQAEVREFMVQQRRKGATDNTLPAEQAAPDPPDPEPGTPKENSGKD